MEASGGDGEPDLGSMERDRHVGVDDCSGDLSRRRIHAGGQIDGDHRRRDAALIRAMSSAASCRGAPWNPVPKSASTTTS